jgi:hypothetical protein
MGQCGRHVIASAHRDVRCVTIVVLFVRLVALLSLPARSFAPFHRSVSALFPLLRFSPLPVPFLFLSNLVPVSSLVPDARTLDKKKEKKQQGKKAKQHSWPLRPWVHNWHSRLYSHASFQ